MNWTERIYRHSPVFLQEAGITAFGAVWRWRRFGPGFETALREAKEREGFGAAQWEEYQVRRLREVLVTAIRYVPWYQERTRRTDLWERSASGGGRPSPTVAAGPRT